MKANGQMDMSKNFPDLERRSDDQLFPPEKINDESSNGFRCVSEDHRPFGQEEGLHGDSAERDAAFEIDELLQVQMRWTKAWIEDGDQTELRSRGTVFEE